MRKIVERICCVLMFSLFLSYAHGQEVVRATRQGWAGGVCCVSGVNYSVTLLLNQEDLETIEVEKIYLQGQPAMEGDVQLTGQGKDGKSCIITFGTRRDETRSIRIMPIDPNEIRRADIRQFEGEALLILPIDNQLTEVIVREFEEMPYLAYP